ncbi:hypothetical protein CAY91_17015 [Pseudomonas aeruginosa]|nr:hypothetical protein CAY91_17015 [Pseudomonas aeruginosa]OTK15380.1 hypothetical protein CAZ08_00855 [Pseudomonas aeruginosa]OTK21183.1 hypothetical protein CAZ27_01305 [Pseudomonas aeruginosa]RRW93724.1 hypothetical protein EGJ69_00320 [Pseudomonas aeruginosa]TYT49070.1 hypothetical protein FZO85_12440 [Pseudomonas aeruginosa]
MDSCDMIVLRLLGRNCPEPSPARRSASRHRGEDGHGRKRASTRSPLRRERRGRVKGNSKTAYTRPLPTPAFVQAECAGPQGPKASGVKAGRPRFGTKRGA